MLKLNSVVAQIIIWKSFFGRLFFSFRDNPLPYALNALFFQSIVLSCLFFVYFFMFASLARVCVAILLAISIWLLNICCIWQRTRYIYILCHSFDYISFQFGYACASRFAWLTSTRLIHEIVLFLFRFWFVCAYIESLSTFICSKQIWNVMWRTIRTADNHTQNTKKKVVERDTF